MALPRWLFIWCFLLAQSRMQVVLPSITLARISHQAAENFAKALLVVANLERSKVQYVLQACLSRLRLVFVSVRLLFPPSEGSDTRVICSLLYLFIHWWRTLILLFYVVGSSQTSVKDKVVRCGGSLALPPRS